MEDLTPITREEMYLSAIAGLTELPSDMTPITREEMFLQEILDNGGAGGGEATGTKNISITENGVTTHNIKAYATAQITTNVPNPSTGTKQIDANGTHDVTDYASAQVNVPNSYSSSDEGKVVSDGALVAQTSKTVNGGGTYDTTLNNEVVVDVEEYYVSPNTGCIYPKKLNQTIAPVNEYDYGGGRYRKCTELKEAYIEGFLVSNSSNGNWFYGCTSLEKLTLPDFQSSNSYVAQGCTSLQQVQLGSIGHPVSVLYGNAFNGCTRNDLVITIYVSDSTTIPLSGSPFGATNATIVYRSSTTGEVRTS